MSKGNRPATEGGAPVRSAFLVFGAPQIGPAEIEEVAATLRSGWLGTGPRVARFEEAFRAYAEAAHAVALNSCTAGLHLALIVLGIGEGDEVITTPMTFAATANVILHCGARPVFVDVDPDTLCLDPEEVENAITPRTKAILPVHFAGRPCEMDEILDIASRHGLRVIEDAAHAIEAGYHGRKIGSLGDVTAFSFYVTKNLTTGEGGMVTTGNAEWAEKIRLLSLHGLSR
ncbi:MAG: DegT/DnrJ/EryC1/StrS family aminotransferase, partial [Vicinamibacteria bacterium]